MTIPLEKWRKKENVEWKNNFLKQTTEGMHIRYVFRCFMLLTWQIPLVALPRFSVCNISTRSPNPDICRFTPSIGFSYLDPVCENQLLTKVFWQDLSRLKELTAPLQWYRLSNSFSNNWLVTWSGHDCPSQISIMNSWPPDVELGVVS